jgi:hypothetical protein
MTDVTIPSYSIFHSGKKFKILSARVCLDDMRFPDALKLDKPDPQGRYWFDIPAAYYFKLGLRAALADPGLVAAVHIPRKKTMVSSIRATLMEFYYMKSLGLTARQTIEIGICQDRAKLPAHID